MRLAIDSRRCCKPFALIAHESRGHHGTELAALLHREEHIARAQQHVRGMIRDLLAEAAGDVRHDIAPDELASYCLHARAAAGGLPSKAARRDLADRPDQCGIGQPGTRTASGVRL
ncbi:MAG TPA: hypothetical protein VFY84_12255 [Jiangellales bacterium]|nr:hypothetical protein [Jiangellales bacterium]